MSAIVRVKTFWDKKHGFLGRDASYADWLDHGGPYDLFLQTLEFLL